MHIPYIRHRTGAVLIVVLGILFILSLLAITFAQVTSLDRSVAHGYLDDVRAKLVARSGVEWAVDRLSAAADRGVFADPAMLYWGSVSSESGAPDASTPLESALNPSYAWENEPVQNPGDANPTPLPVSIDGRFVGISQPIEGGTYAPRGDIFRLRVSDANSMICLNDGLEHGPDGNVSRNLRRILNTLGSIVGIQSGDAGDRILAARPSGGYRSKSYLESVLGRDDYLRIIPYVTAGAWSDPDVVNPVPLSVETLPAYPVPYNQHLGLFRYGRSFSSAGTLISDSPLRWAPEFASPTGTDHAVIALDELNAQWIERVRRSPVNVNLAPKPVLTALICGLRGFFLVERRKSNPGQGMYTFLFHTRYDNTPSGKRGDEIGYLYSTRAFLAPGSAGDGIPAEHVADEMIACRNREPSPHLPGLHYAAVWYGGPFRSWRQFNAFCDGLVSGGLLDDTRPIFFDFDVTNAISWRLGGGGSDDLVASDIQRKLAAQAMADVLKANFNPNCTLNELNPDANLCTLIDKTDLIVNSTEFCFTSMGTVEIESEGLILRTPGGQDFLTVRSASTVARKKIHCLVQIYDTYRETTQADFALGESQTVTGDKTVELGPEPAGSASATQCRWSGWIQLATAGGPGLACDRSSAMHAHFASDHRLHHHADGLLDPIGATPRCRNNPDRTEPLPGPYGPALGPRDWQISHPPANPQVRAPGDLRIDGAYVERDSSLMFANSLSVYDSTGTVAMWVKPSFRPEMAGKPRTFFSVDTLKSDSVNSGSGRGMPASGSSWQIVNGLWFFASADAPAFTPSPNEGQFPFYSPGPWRPASIVCGYSTWSANGGGVGMASDTLNHRAHVHAPKPDLLRHHGWTHLTYLWDMPRYELALWINGQPQPNSEMIQVHPRLISAVDYQEPGNTIRLGEPSLTMQLDTSEPLLGRPVSRNWAADATIDEFYLWKGNQLDRGQELFAQGRYHRPTPAAEAVFTSQGIRFSGSMRDLPPPSTVAPPVSVIAAPPSGGASRPSTRVLAAAWTWYPESLSWTGQPQVHDYRDDTDVQARVEMNLLLNGVTLPFVLSDDAGALVPNLTMTPEDSLRYRLSMRLPNANPDVILLATPVIDDVTLHFSTGIHFLFYELVGMSI